MDPVEATLTQYRVLSARRHHFGWQFWFTIAFSLAMVLGGAAVYRDADEPLRCWLIVGAGLALLQTAFIAHRVREIEDVCEREMRAIEERLQSAGHAVVVAPLSRRFGARTVVTLSLAVAGAGLLLLGLAALV